MQTPNSELKKKTHPKATQQRPSLKETEFTVYGWNACHQIFIKRPQDILRVFFNKDRMSQIQELLKWCRQNRLPYRQLDAESLNKVAAGVHHEGIVIVAKPLKFLSAHTLTRNGLGKESLMVALDGVDNSHNVGAILRSCAFFGCDGLILPTGSSRSPISSSLARTAEGALEWVTIYNCKSMPSTLRDLKNKGVYILGMDSKAKQSLYNVKVKRPCVLVFGNEQAGLSSAVKGRCNNLVRIPGQEPIESLNVSVAAGVALAKFTQ